MDVDDHRLHGGRSGQIGYRLGFFGSATARLGTAAHGESLGGASRSRANGCTRRLSLLRRVRLWEERCAGEYAALAAGYRCPSAGHSSQLPSVAWRIQLHLLPSAKGNCQTYRGASPHPLGRSPQSGTKTRFRLMERLHLPDHMTRGKASPFALNGSVRRLNLKRRV